MKLTEAIRSTLRPETLVAINDFSFVERARAVPGVEDASESFFDVAKAGSDVDIDVERVLDRVPEYQQRQIVTKDYIIVGGLCIDRDAANPLESSDGEGSIYHRGRRARQDDEERAYYEAFGLDSDGNPDLGHDVVCRRLGDIVWNAVRKDRNLHRRLKRLMERHGETRGVEEAIRIAADYQGEIHEVANAFAGVYLMWRLSDEDQERLQPVVDLIESHKDKAWEDAIKAGELGNWLAQPIDIYEHGGVAYSLAGEGMICRWDTTSCGAVWVPDQYALENIETRVIEQLTKGLVKWSGAVGSLTDPLYAQYSLDGGNTWLGHFAKWTDALNVLLTELGVDRQSEQFRQAMHTEARSYCRSVLDVYTNWANGDCYGVCIYMIDRATGELALDRMDHEVWGYIGQEYAESELESEMLQAALALGRTLH